MRKIFAFSLLAALLVSIAAASNGPLSDFNEEELETLKEGEAVYRHVEKKGEDGETKGHGESYIIINAPVDKCFSIFTEFNKQHLYFPRKTKSEVVKRLDDNRVLVHKVFEFYVVDVQYHVLYTVDKDKHRVDFEMDPEYPHDIEDTAGYFKFETIDDKSTLFTYAATKVETGLKVPGFIRNYITSKDLPAVVENVKKRIESGGTWEKD